MTSIYSLLNSRWESIKIYSYVWVCYWFLVMGVLVFGFKASGFNYDNSPILLSLYFLLASFGTPYAVSHFDILKSIPRLKKQLVFCFLIFILWFSSILLWEAVFPLSESAVVAIRSIKFYLPLFAPGVAWTKCFDIIFQQTMIAYYVFFWQSKGVSKGEIVKTFSITFFLLHIPTFLEFGWYSLFFTIPSAGAGIIFSCLMLYKKEGIVFSVGVHLLFYLILGLGVRSYYSL